MMRVFLLLMAFVVTSKSALCQQTNLPTKRPNIVFILADDLGYAELGCYGNRFNETPHLDKLAKRGMLFRHAYSAAPVCSPTRAALMTGQYPARVGITDYLRPNSSRHLSTDHVTWAEVLRRAGYVTGIIGKWHLSGYRNHGAKEVPPTEHGFDEVIVSENRGIGGGSYFHPYHFNKEIKRRLSGKEYLVDRCNQEAVHFIERHKNRPFCLFLSHYAVHTRLVGKPKLVAKFAKKPGAGNGMRAKRNNPHLAAQLFSIDQGVGMIMAKLRELGLEKDTLVIFASDNGGESRVTINGVMRAGKSTLYEGGVRVPLIVHWPEHVKESAVCDTPVITMDFYQTFLDAAKAKRVPKQKLDGVSMLPLWRNPNAEWKRNALYWHYPLQKPHFLGGRSSGAIRAGSWKLVEDFTTGKLELFDLSKDSGGNTNIAAKHPARAKELHERLIMWRKEVGAKTMKHMPSSISQ